jgi:hypothetical protein
MNLSLKLADEYIHRTNRILFLTGKAGTGKTTFLRQLRQNSPKNLAVVAPTGVAAINAGGMTIHSFFQLPFGPLLPNSTERSETFFAQEKRDLLQALELLIIDEISMVRPDVLDRIDLLLRHIKGSDHPFGGVQLLLIGDLSQLSPIVRDDDWSLLRNFYATPYFFSSLVMANAGFVRIELQEVFRQTDPIFVDILNQVRDQRITDDALKRLNECYRPSLEAVKDHIILTTHNRIVQDINSSRLKDLQGDLIEFKATIRGEFPADAHPTEINLQLKVGAQVMFVKNDNSAEKLFFNGKIGQVVRMTSDTVFVQCGNEDREISVQALEWSNIKYKLEGEQIGESMAGSFAQVPLKLAWAITIHKSQGLTFDKAIVDVSEAFAPGQTYVALSRCRSLEGLLLRQPVAKANIIADPYVKNFDAGAPALTPDANTLASDEEYYRQFLLQELFNFSTLDNALGKLPPLHSSLEQDVIAIAVKTKPLLAGYTADRIKKAAAYFNEKLRNAVGAIEPQLRTTADGSKTQAQKADALMDELLKKADFMAQFSEEAFSAEGYLSFKRKDRQRLKAFSKALNAHPHEELVSELLNWRKEKGARDKVIASMIFSDQTLSVIGQKLPASLKALSAIKGVGPQKARQFGTEVLSLIRNYQNQQSGSSDQVSLF